ncbi:shikimate dehydrogenase [Inconstantimicrobium mannanitabidum]|uniref:Uncharacterized protein n=1 Tax=Inconstantimicrobium mannanitabidum TaxID=1604901 RepID=A0ACB5R8S2_9CLOT|nr:shikimate dehydrogenase [Clostridium sp. TW13]GKX65426.1 hypothetical protein rsdtw13_06840 [Clostridium sp. TW13]
MKTFGLIGEKLSHSLSPEIHNVIFQKLGIKATYNLFEVENNNIAEVGEAIRVLNIKGVNITIPYKEEVINSVEELSKEAEKIGAINTIINCEGVLKGYNTDYYGFGRMLNRFSVSLQNKKVVILGTGGAAKAVAQYVSDSKPRDVVLIARNKEKAKRTFKKYDVFDYKDLKNIVGDIIVNTTPVGMYPNMGESPVGTEIIKKYNTAVDIIFNPIETEFLRLARENGLKTIDGLYMLVGQAVKAEEIWLDTEISNAVEEEIYLKIRPLLEEKL